MRGSTKEAGPFRAESVTIPRFQRDGNFWDHERKVRLIESIWMGLPIAAYVVNQCLDNEMATDNWLIDGQQRWTAIREYAAGGFPVQGYRFIELSKQERLAFKMTIFPCIITNSPDPVLLEDFYNRLAYGGVPHDPDDVPVLGGP